MTRLTDREGLDHALSQSRFESGRVTIDPAAWNFIVGLAESWVGSTNKTFVHLAHCNFGENDGMCKYGDEDDCPAIREWGWLRAAYAQSDNSAQHDMFKDGSMQQLSTWYRGLRELGEQFIRSSNHVLEALEAPVSDDRAPSAKQIRSAMSRAGVLFDDKAGLTLFAGDPDVVSTRVHRALKRRGP